MQPSTVLGKCVGSLCAISGSKMYVDNCEITKKDEIRNYYYCHIAGVLVMSIPIPIIVNNFQAFYGTQRSEIAAKKRKIRIDGAKVEEHKTRMIDLGEEDDDEQEEQDVLRRDSSITPLFLLKRTSRA